jgi:hypothetical protein
VLIVFTNIDIISGPCNNIIKDREGRLETLCNQCFMGDKALLRTEFLQQLELVEKIRQNYPDASYFFYPMEIAASQQMIPLMLETGQKAMTNGKKPRISGKLADKGFQQVSFSLYSDWKEMNVFYNYTEKDFDNVLKNIIEAVKRSLEVESISQLSLHSNFKKLPNLYDLSEKLGVSKISLLPLEPLGKAKEMDDGYFLDQDSFEQIIQVVKTLKKNDKPYVSMGLGFGPSRSCC